MLPYKVVGGLPIEGGGGSLMSHTAGSVTTQSIALKYVMAFEPYRNTWYLKQVVAGLLYIKIYFFKTLKALKVKCFWNWLELSWIQDKILGKYAKNLIFH
jgi:hypothetical protein